MNSFMRELRGLQDRFLKHTLRAAVMMSRGSSFEPSKIHTHSKFTNQGCVHANRRILGLLAAYFHPKTLVH